MTPALAYAIDAPKLITKIRMRLESAGALLELDQLRRLSSDELDLLVRLEREVR